jgi:hypothetical protein
LFTLITHRHPRLAWPCSWCLLPEADGVKLRVSYAATERVLAVRLRWLTPEAMDPDARAVARLREGVWRIEPFAIWPYVGRTAVELHDVTDWVNEVFRRL